MPGMRDVAKEAGVSLSTVSVILNKNNTKFVSQETINKVMAAVEKLGYKLPPPKIKEPPTIAVVLPIISNPISSIILSGIENEAESAGYHILFCDSKSSFEKEKWFIQHLKKRDISGLVLHSACPEHQEKEFFETLKHDFLELRKIPMIFLQRAIQDNSFFSIGFNDKESAYAATKYLHSIGRKRIAHIKGPSNFISSERRFQGYFEALKGCNIEPDHIIIEEGKASAISGYVAMKKILLKCGDVDGVFACTDQLAIGAMKAIKEAGKKVPEDIAVVGFGNISHATLIDPALTTINIPVYEMGRRAAEIIIHHKKKHSLPHVQTLEGNLIVRKSTDASASNEWELLGC